MGVATQIWQDRFTGTRYLCGPAWCAHVRRHLAAHLGRTLQSATTLQAAADRAGRFWSRTYYAWLFPLRLGRDLVAGQLTTSHLLPPHAEVALDDYAAHPLRAAPLDGQGLPPILPDPTHGADGWLLADQVLLEAACLTTMLGQYPELPSAIRHAVRLATLIAPFAAELMPIVQPLADLNPVFAARANAPSSLPVAVSSILRQVADRQFGNQHVTVVMIALQRIKQYVFETPGLNEIRGGSTMLDQITDDLRAEVEAQLGPEVVLRAAGSTLLFLAPDTPAARQWPAYLRQTFFERTGTAFPAAVAVRVPMQDLVGRYHTAMSRVHAALAADRASADGPTHPALPFETRCALCKTRPAEGWEALPDADELEPEAPTVAPTVVAASAPETEGTPKTKAVPVWRPLCAVCKTKRGLGLAQRRRKLERVLLGLGMRDPGLLGVNIKTATDWVADDLALLAPTHVRRQLIGVVYGDGNNFGAVAMDLPDLALGRQWAARVEQTTHAAVALALGQATQHAARLVGWQPGEPGPLDHLPFQVLAVGGDDLSLFAWAPVAVAFAATFAQLTDLELQATSAARLRNQAHLSFSLGVLVTDAATPVITSVAFVENYLLKWAKQAVRERALQQGTIALLTALTAEAIPADLQRYRREVFLLGAAERFALCTTLRPYVAAELLLLLEVARTLVNEGRLGQLQELASALYAAREGVLAGLLHYAYQRGRLDQRKDAWLTTLEQTIAPLAERPSSVSPMFSQAINRPPFGLGAASGQPPTAGSLWFTPLGDLIELAKLLS